jgi:hypothetical protein
MEYLKGSKDLLDANLTIATACLTYLLFDVFAKGPCSDNEIPHRLMKYPFLEYATLYWGIHARGRLDFPIQDLALRVLCQESTLLSLLQVAIHVENQGSPLRGLAMDSSALHIAASFGLVDITVTLLEIGYDLGMRDSKGNTALSIAASRGYEAVVRLLLKKGSNVKAKDINGKTALH